MTPEATVQDLVTPLFADAKGRPVAAPDFGGQPIADTHAHLDMLEDPAAALANAAQAGIGFIATVADPSEDAPRTYKELPLWIEGARELIAGAPSKRTSSQEGEPRSGEGPLRGTSAEGVAAISEPDLRGTSAEGVPAISEPLPQVRIILGVHPHNAKGFTPEVQAILRELATDPLTCAIGEIGLDYHYDYSPRDVQRDIFRRQLELAHELALPAVVHLREAHGDGERILRTVGVPPAGCILHCYNLDAAQMRVFLDLGCYISFAGPVTFKKSPEIREAAALVPSDRILTETDCPFMAPEPFRGRKNEPAYTVFTAARIAEARGEEPSVFAVAAYANARRVLDGERTP